MIAAVSRGGDIPGIIIWERVLLEIDKGLSGSGRLGGRSSDRCDGSFVVLGPLNIATGA